MKTLNDIELNRVAGGCVEDPSEKTSDPFGPGGMPGPTDPIGPQPEPADDLIWTPGGGFQL